MNKAIETLKERGFFNQCTDLEGLSSRMDNGPVAFYVGCDPTGSSLHIGHMVPFFALRWLRSFGHTGVALIGGGIYGEVKSVNLTAHTVDVKIASNVVITVDISNVFATPNQQEALKK